MINFYECFDWPFLKFCLLNTIDPHYIHLTVVHQWLWSKIPSLDLHILCILRKSNLYKTKNITCLHIENKLSWLLSNFQLQCFKYHCSKNDNADIWLNVQCLLLQDHPSAKLTQLLDVVIMLPRWWTLPDCFYLN